MAMVDYPGVVPRKSYGVGSFTPGRRQAHYGLALLLTVCLGLILAMPAAAADGALDTTFNMGSGQFAGVQNIPEIRGIYGYPYGTTPGSPPTPWPYNNCNLVFGTFWGLTVGSQTPTPNTSCIARLLANGTVDTGFNFTPQGQNSTINGEIRGVFIYPHNYPVASLQDKILIWGRFNAQSGSTYYTNIARLNAADGSIDTTFPVINSYGGAVNTVAVQGGGFNGQYVGAGNIQYPAGDKVLVGGYNLRAQSSEDGPAYQLIRLNYDGNVDTGFAHWSAPNAYIYGIRPFYSHPLFGTSVGIYCIYPKYTGSGAYYFLLVNSSVNVPSSTNAPISFIGSESVDGPIFATTMQNLDGKVVIGGQFKNAFGASRKCIARLTYTSGVWALDTGYDPGSGGSGGPNGVVTGIVPMMSNSPYDDRMLVVGSFSTWNGSPCGGIVRLTADTPGTPGGALDGSFNSGGTGADDRVRNIWWNPNGSGGWISGYFHKYNSGGTDYSRGGVAGLNPDGTVNGGFANITANAGWPGMVYSLAKQSDGKIIIGGDFNGVCGKYRGGMARINPDGSLDLSFKVLVDGVVNSVALQDDGKILLGGPFGQCQGYAVTSLARLNPDGNLDHTFNPLLLDDDNSLNNVYQVLPLANGQVMIAGDIYNATGSGPVARLNSDGGLDTTFFNNVSQVFNPAPDTSPIPGVRWLWGSRVAVAGSNYLVAGGGDTGTGVNGAGYLIRLSNNGTLDNSFGPAGPVPHFQTMDGAVQDMLLQPDGNILVSGQFTNITSYLNTVRTGIARFSADGLLDSTFTPSLTLPTGANTLVLPAMARQPDGKILIEEHFLNYTGGWNYNYLSSQVARLKTDGSLDPNFNLGTPANGWFYPQGGSSILRLPGGKALVGGCFSNYTGTPAFSLVRIFAGANPNPALLFLLQN